MKHVIAPHQQDGIVIAGGGCVSSEAVRDSVATREGHQPAEVQTRSTARPPTRARACCRHRG